MKHSYLLERILVLNTSFTLMLLKRCYDVSYKYQRTDLINASTFQPFHCKYFMKTVKRHLVKYLMSSGVNKDIL